MLAVCTSSSLLLIDPPTLKKAPPSVPATCTFSNPPTTSTWAPDNTALFVANDNSIQRYDPAGTLLNAIPSDHPVAALASRERGGAVVIGSGDQVAVLDASSGRVALSLETHSGAVSALALAPDGAALASTSCAIVPEVHVHNLAGALPHVELQGLPRRGDVRACTFHPHSKARLLVAVGALLLVYDIAKPGAPLKTVQLDRKAGEVVAITCSPFSKSLVAVGCGAGVVHLVDLDKEKCLFRTIPLEARLSSLVFSPEGAALYAGTDEGKLLILDLRALDKPPKSIDVGAPVVCMSVQRKLKPSESPARPRPGVTTLSKRRTDNDATEKPARSAVGSSAMPSSSSAPQLKPRVPVAGKGALSPGPSPGRSPRTRTISATSSAPKLSTKLRVDNSKSTPPEPNPRAPSVADKDMEPPAQLPPVPKRPRTVSAATSASSRATASSAASKITRMSSSTSATSVEGASPRTRKISGSVKSTLSPPRSPAGSRAATPAERPITSRIKKTIAMLSAANQEKNAGPSNPRSRTASTTSTRSASGPVASSSTGRVSASGSTSTVSPSTSKTHVRARTLSSRSSATNVTRPTKADTRPATNPSPIPPVPPLPEAFKDQEQLTGIDIKWTISRTPSPDPQDDTDVMNTPMPMARRNKGKGKEPMQPEGPKTNVLGLGTPELKRWIDSEGESESVDDALEEHPVARRVEFLQVPENEVQIENIRIVREDAPDEGAGAGTGAPGEAGKATVQMTLQISPRRSSEKLSPHWTPVPSLFSPSRTASMHGGGGEPGGSSSAGAPPSPAHELLQSLIRDAMYDFRRETKAEILGLHLDLVRMGRGWRKELREALESWGDELKEIRRENELLRQENERLRRGY
ncbi:WD40-repeat-containing domain protein [Phanerochaete sordida]|uniref:WD40-repeat-containing domain protein n=1 Tax=Phanerochaete sordida TaxID=48140 RepID=A0A9P3GAH5_9APHY|nr:WD40-repeat-containing domain protein [Phanerochaete sordida]